MSNFEAARGGILALDEKMHAHTQNLANMNTPCYKKQEVIFQESLYLAMKESGSAVDGNSPLGIMRGTGVNVAGIKKNFTQGALVKTNNVFDVAIKGEKGFFKVSDQNGNFYYTRDGRFLKNSEGYLVTSTGYIVEPSIKFDVDDLQIKIGKDGTVTAVKAGTTHPYELGEIELVAFTNPDLLKPIGDNLYLPSEASGEPFSVDPNIDGVCELKQHYVESSNVETMGELIAFLDTQRDYEALVKIIKAKDEMSQYVIKNF